MDSFGQFELGPVEQSWKHHRHLNKEDRPRGVKVMFTIYLKPGDEFPGRPIVLLTRTGGVAIGGFQISGTIDVSSSIIDKDSRASVAGCSLVDKCVKGVWCCFM